MLGLPPGRMSEILANKRPLTPNIGRTVADRLGLDPTARTQFLATIQKEKASRKKPTLGTPAPANDKIDKNYQQLSVDAFHVISDWYHFAILSLVETDDFRSEPKWIAKRLGISVIEVRTALERLLRLELLEQKNKTIKRTAKNLTTTQDVQSSAIRHSHRQVLEKAVASLEEVAVADRDITSISMAMDPKKLPIAKEMIRQFRRTLCSFLESDKKEEIYYLTVQLFPVTRKQSKVKNK